MFGKKRNKKSDVPTINKIEIDEETGEPIFMETEAPQNVNDEEKTDKTKNSDGLGIKDLDKMDSKEARKQLAMQTFLGIDREKEQSINKRQKIFKWSFTILFVAFVLAVLIYTAVEDFTGGEPVSWEVIGNTLKNKWHYLFVAAFGIVACYFIRGIQRSLICKTLTGKALFRLNLETGIIGQMYNFITPLAVGGQPFEVHYLSKHGVRGGYASSIPIGTYIINAFANVAIGVIALVLLKVGALQSVRYVDKIISVDVIFILAIVGLSLQLMMPLMVLLFCFFPRLSARLVYFFIFIGYKLKIVKNKDVLFYRTLRTVSTNSRCLKKLMKKPLLTLVNFLLTFAEQFAYLSIAYFTLKLFGFGGWIAGEHHNLAEIIVEGIQIIMLCVILNAAVSFFPTPGNSGAADLSFYSMFSAALAKGLAFPAMVFWRLMCFYSFIIIGFIFIRAKASKDKKHGPYKDLIK